jgi:deoxycytidine triphosphate deaminase
MTVAHIPSRKTVSEQEYASHKGTDSSLVLLIDESAVENFSIELTVGNLWSDRYDKTGEMIEIDSDGLTLPPRGSIVVEVAELIGLPFNLYGLVIPTGSLFLDRGIIIAAAKVEPAFKGRLKLRLVNTTAERRPLAKGQKVASVVLFSTDETMFAPETGKKVMRHVRPPSITIRMRKWAIANLTTIIGWVVSSCFGAVAALLIKTFIIDNRADANTQPNQAASPTSNTIRRVGRHGS